MIKKAIITGATGAIGMALVQKLIKENIQALVIAHKGSERIKNLPQSALVQTVEADLEELQVLKLPEQDWDVFYHLAWGGTFGEARNDMYLQNDNIRYTLDAVRLAHRSGCRFFVGAGSQAEYGRQEGILREDTPVRPENGYGMAKLCAGQMSRQLCAQLGMRHIWTRILSVYGPYDGENTMISSAIRNILEGKQTHFTKGEQMWDYLYSEDAAEILFRLAERGKDGRVYVLGSGKVRRLREYIEVLAQKLNFDGALGIGDIAYAGNQVMHLEADIQPLWDDIGYIPATEFEDGIAAAIKCYKTMNCKLGPEMVK